MITDAKGEPIVVGASVKDAYDETKIDDEPIVQDLLKIELKLNEGEFLKTGPTDEPDSMLPKSLRVVKLPDKRLKSGFRNVIYHTIKEKRAVTVGSAGIRDLSIEGPAQQVRHNEITRIIPLDVLRIRMMTDPYTFTIRRLMSDAIFQDPTLAPGAQKRNKAFFANGYYLDIELKSTINPVTGQPYSPDETQGILNAQRQIYLAYLLQLDTWARLPTIDILDKMKRSHISVIDQGRALNLIVPKPADLQPQELPISVRNITWENTGQVYVDTIYWQVVGVRLFFINKDMATPDEMVYILGKNWGLRWLSDFYGASELEPFLQMSRINRKILNYHLAKATENAYMAKIILSVDVAGDPNTKKQQITNLVNSVVNQGTDVIGLENRTTAQPIPVSADSDMMKMIIDTLDDRLISGIGSTRAQMGRTENLNRDTATIMEVENIRNVRTPDEELVGTAFATQMFDPLMAHLAGIDTDQIPVRVVIKRVEPTDEATDPDLENKLDQLKGASQGKAQGSLVQDDAGGQGSLEGTKSFGASGLSLLKQREDYLMKVMIDTDKKTVNRNQVVKILLNEFSNGFNRTVGASGESSESKEAKMEDVEAWYDFGNISMQGHYLNPQNWDDTDNFIQPMLGKKFSELNPAQKEYAIRAFYFRNPSFSVTELLKEYGVTLPTNQSAYCWTVLTPVMRMHLLDPNELYSWSRKMVIKDYQDLNPEEKEKADKLSQFRHSDHVAGQIPSSIGSSKKKA